MENKVVLNDEFFKNFINKEKENIEIKKLIEYKIKNILIELMKLKYKYRNIKEIYKDSTLIYTIPSYCDNWLNFEIDEFSFDFEKGIIYYKIKNSSNNIFENKISIYFLTDDNYLSTYIRIFNDTYQDKLDEYNKEIILNSLDTIIEGAEILDKDLDNFKNELQYVFSDVFDKISNTMSEVEQGIFDCLTKASTMRFYIKKLLEEREGN